MRKLMAAALSILVSLASSTTAIAGTSTPGFAMFEGTWSVQLDDERMYVREGSATRDGYCRYDYPDLQNQTEGLWYYMRVVGIDSTNCRQLIVEGTSVEPPIIPSGDSYLHDSETALSADHDRPTAPDSVGGRKQGVNNVQWVDPIGLPVNWVRNTTTFTYDYTCAFDGNSGGSFGWLSISGWYRQSSSTTHLAASDCEWWQGQSKATYRNDVFCGLQTTQAVYDYVRVKGWYDGNVTFSRSSYVTGPCAPLLNMEFSTSVTSL